MFGRSAANSRMRGRNDINAQKRRVLVTVCTLVLMFSLVSLYLGSFFSNRRNKLAVHYIFDPSASGLEANLVVDSKNTVLEKGEVSEKVDASGERSEASDDEESEDKIASTDDTLEAFPVCDAEFSETIPCLDLKLNKKLKLKLNHPLMEHYERHCPPQEHRLQCLIPPPPNYKVPIRWPKSRDEVWQSNVPHNFLAIEKSDQHWMVVNGQKVIFPGGGTHFPNGADKYIASLAKMLKNEEGNLSMDGKIRTVLDIGCGVASFGAYLLSLEVIAMSIAPNDVHQNQIQFALERGIPATLGVLGTKRVPYPSNSFDLAHCSRCRIEWHQRDGILLLEVDRLLKPGGYFIWSAPPAYREDVENRQIWKDMTELVTNMCWTVAAHQDQTVIWQKPLTNECYEKRPEDQVPPLCKTSDPDSAWEVPMEACINPLPDEGRNVEPWPKRMVSPSSRLKQLRIEEKKFLSASSSLSNMTGSSRKDYQEQLTFEDLIRMDPHVQEEPALDIDHTGEASIVLMKPVNYHSSRPVTPPPATKDVDFNSETSGPSGFEREKIEIRHRGRGSERRAGSSGRASRSHSLESLEKRSADKVQVEDQSFANVMLSWRERIAADAARKASIDMAEAKPHSRSKSSTPVKHRSREVSPLQYDARDAGSTERRAGSRSPRPQASIEEYLFNNREENDALSRKVLSDAQEYSSHDEDKFKMVGRSKSDLQVSAASTEAVDAMDASLDKVSAQVSVVRNKRTSVKSSRSKDKHRASHPGDLNAKASSKSPSSGNTEASSSADQVVQDPILDLKDHKESSSALNSTAQEESLKIPDVDSRVTPKKRKTAEPVVMLEEEKPQLPRVVTPVVEVKGPSNEEEDFSTSVEVVPNPQVVPSAHSEQEQEEEDVKMEDAFDGTVGQISEGFSSGRDKCFSEDGALGLQGADHPSPVSVLDSPIYREEFHLEELSASPDSVKSVMAGHEDVEAIPHLDGAVACEPEPEVLTPRSWASKDTSDPLRDIYTKLASTLEMNEKEICRGQLVADLQIPFIVDTHQTHGNVVEVISVEKSKERLYVQSILTESGLTQEDSRLTEDAAEIMQFEVFTRKEEELQTEELERIDRGELEKTEELRYKESLDRRLIFDCMNEILERKMSPYLNPQPWGTPVVRRMPRGQRLIDEVWDELKDMHWPTSAAYDALYAVLQKDFMRKSFQWLDFSVEVGDVGCELESMLLQELVEELVQDIFSIELKLVKELCQELPLCPPSPLPVHHSPLHTCSIRDSPRAPSEATSEVSLASPEMSPVSSDDSVRRRRELLDKTRRDLLAWHVQYQQL